MSDFGAGFNDFLSGLLQLLGEVSELLYLSFDEGVPQLSYGAVDYELVGLAELEETLPKRIEGGLHPVAGLCAQLDCEHRVSFTHGEVGTRASVVEYEPHVFGLAFIVVSVINGRCDTESSVGPILDEWGSRVCISCGVIDDIVICACDYNRGCR